MIQSFKCPSCAAPLEFKGTPTQVCEFCGGTVIAPSEMFAGAPQHTKANFGSIGGHLELAMRVAEVKRLLQSGQKIAAIKVFRETFGVGLKEAKDAVEAMERGHAVHLPSGTRVEIASAMTPQQADVVKKVAVGVGGVSLLSIIVGLVFGGGGILFAAYMVYWQVFVKGKPSIVVSSGNGIQPKAEPANELFKFGEGQFTDNRSVAVGPDKIYSSDYNPMLVKVFDLNGKFLTVWKPDGPDTNLWAMAADRKGNVYAATGRGLFKFEGETGKQLASVPESGGFGGVALWGEKIVATTQNAIKIFDTDLHLQKDYKDAGLAASVRMFGLIAVDGSGNLYTSERVGNEICKFSPDGKFLTRIAPQLGSIEGLAFDREGKRLFIADVVKVYALDQSGAKLNEFASYQSHGLAFDSDGDLFVATRPTVTKYKLNF